MAVALQTTTRTSNGEAEARDAGGGEIRMEAAPPKTTAGSDGDGDAVVYKKGAWSKEEDAKLRKVVEEYGIKNWVNIEKFSGLSRPAKNCRLRWLNYLRPNLKKYPFTEEEEKLIFDLHSKYGNSWARIAAKLPGRSDNEIKNFWHKRAKKCRRENLPTTPPEKKQKQSHTNVPNIIDNHSSLEANTNPPPNNNYYYFPTNHPNHTLPQPSTPNIANNANDAPSILSPQSMISTPPPQFLSSPSSLLTSLHQTTPLFSNTPTSQTQNSLLSSSSPSQTVPDHLEAPSLCQGGGGASSSTFTSLRKPPLILSPPDDPLCQFLRATGQLSSGPGDHSTLDSSPQMQWSSGMESPRSSLKLKLSYGIPAQYSLQMSTQTTDSPMGLLSGFQLNSPNTAPPSPLKLRLSNPVPLDSCFRSNLSIPDPTVQMNPSTLAGPLSSQPMTVGTDHTVPLDSSPTVNEQPHSIQVSPADTSGVNSYMHEVESDNSLEIMEELRKAQARVRYLKKKLKQSSRNEHLSTDESPQKIDSLRSEVPLDGNSSQNTINDCVPENTRKKYMLKRIPRRKDDGLQVKRARRVNKDNLDTDSEKATIGENSESKISSEKSLQREESLGEITKNLETFQEQNNVNAPNSDAWGNKRFTLQGFAGRCSNECSSMESLLCESSRLWQDSFLKGVLFGQTYPIEDLFSSQRHWPLIDVFGPIHQEQPADEGGLLSYLQTNDLGYPEHGLMDGNMAAKSIHCETQRLMYQNLISDSLLESQLCEQSFTQHQSHAADLLDLGYRAGKQLMVQESLQGVQFSLQTPETSLIDSRYIAGFEQECPTVEQYCLQTWKQDESCEEQSLIEGLFADNLWPQSQMVLQDQTFSVHRFDSAINPVEFKNWNNESTSTYTGVLQHEQDNMKRISEELSSLLDFTPNTMQALDRASDEF